jgi:lipoate-protein ligase A
MAIDTALHDRAAQTGEGVLRFYRWAPSCLSFGRHEPAVRRYDREQVDRLGLDAVRRPTGGRAVWHAAELTYAVAAPEAAMGSLREACHQIHATIADALRSLGAPAHLAPVRRAAPLDAGACFAVAAGGEVVLGTSKVVGSAQWRSGGALLQHGSVLLDDDQSRIREITRGHAAMPHLQSLSQSLGRPVAWDEVAQAFGNAARSWSDQWTTLEDQAGVLAAAEMHAVRYRDPAWTWAR